MATLPRWFHDPITERQQNAIRVIQRWLGHEFDGTVKGHAMNFIGNYYEEAKRARDIGGVQAVTNREMVRVLESAGPWD